MVGADSGVVVRGLARRFGNRWALVGVDLDVPRGGSLMLTGANGSGKTTLLRCVATALKPHRGTIAVFGEDAWANRGPCRGRIALVSHATRLYEDLSARDNLNVWAHLGGMRIDPSRALARVGLASDRPEPVRAYSAGMRRRVALALALMKSPELFLLDEPFAALDPSGRELVSSLLTELRAGGTTILLATHLPTVAARHCDQAVHLDGGRIVWSGRPADAPEVDPIEAEA